MILNEGDRVKLVGKAWGHRNRNREVYALVTFTNGAWAKVDEQDVLLSGGFVKGFEVELANE